MCRAESGADGDSRHPDYEGAVPVPTVRLPLYEGAVPEPVPCRVPRHPVPVFNNKIAA